MRSHDHDHPALADLWQARAALALDRGDTLTALSWARLGQWHRRRHAVNDQKAIANGLVQLAEILAATGQLDAAQAELARAVPVVERSGSDAERARASFVAAVVHQRGGRAGAAVTEAQRALGLQQRALGWGHPNLLPTLSLLRELALESGDRDGAARYEREAALVAASPLAGGDATRAPHLTLVREPLAA